MPCSFHFPRFLEQLASLQAAVIIFLLVSLLALPGTFLAERAPYYGSWLISLPLALLFASLFLCTVIRRGTLARSVLILHAGILIVAVGFFIRNLFGYVATTNIYEGAAVQNTYRWDRAREMPLGFTLSLKKINYEYYPAPLKIGILFNGEKKELKTLATGESFRLGEHTVTPERLLLDPPRVDLRITTGDTLLGRMATDGKGDLPASFPYTFKLVAFQTPKIKKSWVELEVAPADRPVKRGMSAVNTPFSWENLTFHHVQNAADSAGRPYAGIQIVKDPGRPLVFAGLALVSVGAVLAGIRRFRRGR